MPDGSLLQYIQAIAIPATAAIIAGASALIASRQKEIALIKLRSDLFERRFKVYSAARIFLKKITVYPPITLVDLSAYLEGIEDAPFLFDQRLTTRLDEIAQRAGTWFVQRSDTEPSRPTNFEYGESPDAQWMRDAYARLISDFAPFLRLEHERLLGSSLRTTFQMIDAFFRRQRRLW